MTGYKYMLRFTLQPGHFEEERLYSLIDFCQKARIDDVMFFVNPMNLSHATLEETKPWLETIERAQRLLTELGVTTSINPLNTFLHVDVDNGLREGQNFRLMADPFGNRSTAIVCPLCPEWRKYIIEMYAYYATLHPYSLWVEDDFRFHNHSPLIWGGCFCEEHLREFALQAGVASLEREEFLQGVLATGTPHPYRRIWLDTCRKTLVDLAGDIEVAVHRVSPQTRIGLMTSIPAIHAAEGRDWHGIFKAFDGAQPAIIRPHLPAYMETNGIQYAWDFNDVSRLTSAFIPMHTEMFPELENVPYTLYSKSRSFQKYQLETTLLLGSHGVTLNIIDMVGNGFYPEEQCEQWLHEEKDFLNSVISLNLNVGDQRGVQVVVNEKSSYTLLTSNNKSMEELYPAETFWASLLSAYGIANQYAAEWPQKQSVLALSGQVLRNYTEAQIRELFATHIVLLDGAAVYSLYEMGLGSLCGVTQALWRNVQSYEQITNGREYTGIKEGRMRPNLDMGACLDIQYESDSATIISQIYNVRGDVICSGMTIVNERIFILPYGRGKQMEMLNPIRRAVIQETLQKLCVQLPLMITSYSPHVAVYDFQAGAKQAIFIVNNSLDNVDVIELAGAELSGEEWMEYSRFEPRGKPVKLVSNESRTVVKGNLPAFSMKVLYRLESKVLANPF